MSELIRIVLTNGPDAMRSTTLRSAVENRTFNFERNQSHIITLTYNSFTLNISALESIVLNKYLSLTLHLSETPPETIGSVVSFIKRSSLIIYQNLILQQPELQHYANADTTSAINGSSNSTHEHPWYQRPLGVILLGVLTILIATLILRYFLGINDQP